jgi:hypothetical protein
MFYEPAFGKSQIKIVFREVLFTLATQTYNKGET